MGSYHGELKLMKSTDVDLELHEEKTYEQFMDIPHDIELEGQLSAAKVAEYDELTTENGKLQDTVLKLTEELRMERESKAKSKKT